MPTPPSEAQATKQLSEKLQAAKKSQEEAAKSYEVAYKAYAAVKQAKIDHDYIITLEDLLVKEYKLTTYQMQLIVSQLKVKQINLKQVRQTLRDIDNLKRSGAIKNLGIYTFRTLSEAYNLATQETRKIT